MRANAYVWMEVSNAQLSLFMYKGTKRTGIEWKGHKPLSKKSEKYAIVDSYLLSNQYKLPPMVNTFKGTDSW